MFAELSEKFIISWYPNLLLVLFAVCVFLGIMMCCNNLDRIRSRMNWGFAVIFIISLLGFMTRYFIVPHRHYSIYDEYSNIGYAQSLLHENRFAYCSQGTHVKCEKFRIEPQAGGYHVLLAAWMKVFGDTEKSAFVFSAILGALTVATIGLLGWLLFDSPTVGAWCSFLLCVMPVHLKFSGATDLGIASMLFVVVLFLSACIFMHTGSKTSCFLTVAVLLFLIHVRIENFIFLIFFPLFIFFHRRTTLRETFLKPWHYAFLGLFGLVYIGALCWLIYFGTHYVSVDGWADSPSRRIAYFAAFIKPNINYLFLSGKVPSAVLLLSFIGMAIHACKGGARSVLFWGLFFSVIFLGYTFYYIGNFNGVDRERFTLNFYIPIVLFAGFCIAHINQKKTGPLRISVTVFTLLFLAYSCFWGYKNTFRETPPLGTQIRNTFPVVERLPNSVAVLAYQISPYTAVLDRYSIDLRYIDMSPPPRQAVYIRYLIINDRGLHLLFESMLSRHYRFSRINRSQGKEGAEIFYLQRKY